MSPAVWGPGFNPTLVRLRLLLLLMQLLMLFRFNPTLVRLRPSASGEPLPAALLFQSHAGSIEAGSRKPSDPQASSVSIPRWFD